MNFQEIFESVRENRVDDLFAGIVELLPELSEREIQSLQKGHRIGMRNISYAEGYLDGKGVGDDMRSESFYGLAGRLFDVMPDNIGAFDHPDFERFMESKVREYIDRWIMYNNLFGNSSSGEEERE